MESLLPSALDRFEVSMPLTEVGGEIPGNLGVLRLAQLIKSLQEEVAQLKQEVAAASVNDKEGGGKKITTDEIIREQDSIRRRLDEHIYEH